LACVREYYASSWRYDALADRPSQYKGAAISIVQDLSTIARKERERQNAPAYQSAEPAPAGF